MFDEPEEVPPENAYDPKVMAKDKSDEFRMHAELAAVLEGQRKFDARHLIDLKAPVARDLQQAMGKLEKGKILNGPLLDPEFHPEALRVLTIPASGGLSTNDYHIYRRPGETVIARWLVGDEVELYYTRLQAHFDAGLSGFRDEERQAQEWRQDPRTLAFLDALDAADLKMTDVYLRDVIRAGNLFVLSTQTAFEVNIAYLCDYIMGVPASEIVGKASAPADAPTENDLAWFYKLFALRGMENSTERMCFFLFLQKTGE